MTHRVVVTGMSGITSLGSTWGEVSVKLRKGVTGTRYMPEWEDVEGLHTKLGAPIPSFKMAERFKQKQLRCASRVSRLALTATEHALESAGLLGSEVVASCDTGVAYGSSTGSVDAVAEFGTLLNQRSIHGIKSTSYIRMMPHTTAVNISVAYKTKGRIIPTSSACTSGTLAIGYAYEAIKHGYQKIMLAGGAEEFDVTEAAVFDILYATSLMNQHPDKSPKPFDKNRDGLVIGEGAGTLVLEELDHARNRGAKIFAELIGFGTSTDGNHVTQPSQETMEIAISKACQDATLTPSEIGYISAHAAATDLGDRFESLATANIMGTDTPISSLKSYFGHTLGACGAIEAWLGICGMNEGWFPPTHNLEEVDPKCGVLDYIIGAPRDIETNAIMSNNFAFGGINASLIFSKYHD